MVKATGERVRKTALTILDQLDTTQVADGTQPGLDRESTRRDQPAQERSAPDRAAGRHVEPLPEHSARPVSVAAAQERGL